MTSGLDRIFEAQARAEAARRLGADGAARVAARWVALVGRRQPVEFDFAGDRYLVDASGPDASVRRVGGGDLRCSDRLLRAARRAAGGGRPLRGRLRVDDARFRARLATLPRTLLFAGAVAAEAALASGPDARFDGTAARLAWHLEEVATRRAVGVDRGAAYEPAEDLLEAAARASRTRARSPLASVTSVEVGAFDVR